MRERDERNSHFVGYDDDDYYKSDKIYMDRTALEKPTMRKPLVEPPTLQHNVGDRIPPQQPRKNVQTASRPRPTRPAQSRTATQSRSTQTRATAQPTERTAPRQQRATEPQRTQRTSQTVQRNPQSTQKKPMPQRQQKNPPKPQKNTPAWETKMFAWDIPQKWKWLTFAIVPFVIFYHEVLLRILTGTNLVQNLQYPLFFSCGVGIVLAGLTALCKPKAERILNTIVLYLSALLFTVECIVKNSFQVFMTIGSMLTGAGGVATEYSDNVVSAITGGILKIILFFLPAVLYTIFGKKLQPTVTNRLKITHALNAVICGVVVFAVGIVFVYTGSQTDRYKSKYQFDSATQIFGLVTSMRLDATHSVGKDDESSGFVIDNPTPTTTAPAVASPQETTTVVTKPGETTTEPAETTAPVAQTMAIDFASLAASESDSTVASLDEYVNSLTPTYTNEYTGLFEGKNLILICAEAFSDCVIDEELTPTLYRLQHNGFYFSDYYQPTWGGSTSSGEYSFVMGTVPMDGVETMQEIRENNNYFTMGNQLQRLGYTSCAFHDGEYDYYDRQLTHENLGYSDYLGLGNGLEDIMGWWTGDEQMFDTTIDTYVDQQPFSLYYMTVSGHCTYDADSEYVEKYEDQVRAKYGDKYKDTTVYYLCYQMELESALTTLVQKLEDAGIADDTVIALTADHYPYGLEESDTFGNDEDYVSDLYGYTYETSMEQDHNALIIWSGCLENEDKDMACEISDPTSSMDILPTLSNLFGLEYDSRLLVGRDVFSDAEPIVIWNNYSWKTDQGYYDSRGEEYVVNDGCTMDQDYIDRIDTYVQNKLNYSSEIVSTDYFGKLFGEEDVT